MTPNEIFDRAVQSLQNLRKLNEIFDSGYSPIVFSIAIEIHNILVGNSEAIKFRKGKKFPTPSVDERADNLLAFNKLIAGRISEETVVCEPRFRAPVYNTTLLPFSEWWSRQIIYRASAAIPGTPSGLIPINGQNEVPWGKRATATRRILIQLVRNKIGAHHDSDFPLLLDEVDEAANWMNVSIQTSTGYLSTMDGTLKWGVRPIAAALRQISDEVISAFADVDSVNIQSEVM